MTKDPKGDLDPQDEGPKSISNLLHFVEEGQFHADLSRELLLLNGKLREHAQQRGKAKGSISITIELNCDEYDTVRMKTDFKVKAPVPPRRETTMWLTPGGNLIPENPKQTKLPLAAVPAPATKEVPAEERKIRSI